MSYLTCIVIKENEKEVRDVMEKIAKKDESFKFKIENGILIVESEDKDTAFKRGLWLIKRVDALKNCGFEVKVKRG